VETKIVRDGQVGVATIQNGMLLEIINSTEVYTTGVTRYNLLMDKLKGKNVRFKDMKTYVLNLAKEDGLWNSDDDLQRARTLPLAWYHSIDLFLGWVNRNYAGSYDKRKRSTGSADQQAMSKASVAVAPKKITKARLEKLYKEAENKTVILEFVQENLQDLVASLKAKPELLRALLDALEAEGLK